MYKELRGGTENKELSRGTEGQSKDLKQDANAKKSYAVQSKDTKRPTNSTISRFQRSLGDS